MHGRRVRTWMLVPLLLSGGVLLAQTPSPDDGPAARQFARWLALFNQGDRAALQRYHQQSFPYSAAPRELGNIERELSMSLETAGFDVRKRESGSATRFSAILSDFATHQFARVIMRVETAAPHRVVELVLEPIPTPLEYQLPKGRSTPGGAARSSTPRRGRSRPTTFTPTWAGAWLRRCASAACAGTTIRSPTALPSPPV